jgi:hypothetical protein
MMVGNEETIVSVTELSQLFPPGGEEETGMPFRTAGIRSQWR